MNLLYEFNLYYLQAIPFFFKKKLIVIIKSTFRSPELIKRSRGFETNILCGMELVLYTSVTKERVLLVAACCKLSVLYSDVISVFNREREKF